jgi:hypothetical protein
MLQMAHVLGQLFLMEAPCFSWKQRALFFWQEPDVSWHSEPLNACTGVISWQYFLAIACF